MTMNYRETGESYSQGKWAKGVKIMNSTAEELEKQGLLPKEFPLIRPESSTGEHLRIDKIEAEVEKQVLRYQEFGFPKKLKMTNEIFKNRMMSLVALQPEKYRGRFDIPVIVLGSKIWAGQQYRSIGFNYNVASIAIENSDPKGYMTPRAPHLVWMQDGTAKCGSDKIGVKSFHNDERGANVFDAVGLVVARPDLLKDHSVVLPGSTFGAYKTATLWKDNKSGSQNMNMFDVSVTELYPHASCGR